MTNNNHPITPPPELMQQWLGNYFGTVFNGELSELEKYLVTQTSQWIHEQRGASNEAELQKARDEELEACCEWLASETPEPYINALRLARRPKPPSLAKEALGLLNEGPVSDLHDHEVAAIRRALERLQELEEKGDE